MLTLSDLLRVLADCAGDVGDVDLTGDAGHRSFEAIGYDSLALMEMAARLKQEHGIELTDQVIADAETPADLLKVINAEVTL
jgi:minimal PKS acyl carrier protein